MSSPTPVTLAVLDLAALDDLKDMLGEALDEIIQSFLDGLDDEVAAVGKGLGGDATAVRAGAHSLKGSAGNLGARALAQFASDMEKYALAGDLAACRELMPALEQGAAQARTALVAYLPQP